MEITIEINVKGVVLKLTPKEVRELRADLDRVLGVDLPDPRPVPAPEYGPWWAPTGKPTFPTYPHDIIGCGGGPR